MRTRILLKYSCICWSGKGNICRLARIEHRIGFSQLCAFTDEESSALKSAYPWSRPNVGRYKSQGPASAPPYTQDESPRPLMGSPPPSSRIQDIRTAPHPDVVYGARVSRRAPAPHGAGQRRPGETLKTVCKEFAAQRAIETPRAPVLTFEIATSRYCRLPASTRGQASCRRVLSDMSRLFLFETRSV